MDYIFGGLWTIGYALRYGHWQGTYVQQPRVVVVYVVTYLKINPLSMPIACSSTVSW